MTRHRMKILPMQRTHIPACSKIAAESEPWRRLGEGIDFSGAVSRSGCRDMECYVCVMGGKTVGFVMFTSRPVFARGGYLRAIAVAPDERGKGIGRKLLAFAEKSIKQKAGNIYLCVSSFNRKAQSFYKSAGYTKVGSLPGLITRGSSEYIYWKRLR